MIERYSRPEMSSHWSLESKFQTWLEVELAAMDALANEGIVTQEVAKKVRDHADFNVARILELEKELKHDVIAFVSNVAENLGPEGRFLHYGLTSSDVLDTSFALMMKRALERILLGLSELKAGVKKRAHEFRDTPQMGRSHGIHAEPVTFGLKLAYFYEELNRSQRRLEMALDQISVGKLSGAVGTYAHLPISVEAYVCKQLGLKVEKLATQVIPRDRHAEVFSALSILAGSIERFSVEVRHLQRTEVRELEERFSKGQKGSSAMPHKRNPVATENLTGCARLMRSYAQAALENIALWHERDISHSSVERVIAPDATILMDYMIHRLTGIVNNMVAYPEQMQKNLEKTQGLIYSQGLLLKLIQTGLSREEAYHLVQRNAMKVWDEGGEFRSKVLADHEITERINEKDLKEIFQVEKYIKSRNEIFKRIFE